LPLTSPSRLQILQRHESGWGTLPVALAAKSWMLAGSGSVAIQHRETRLQPKDRTRSGHTGDESIPRAMILGYRPVCQRTDGPGCVSGGSDRRRTPSIHASRFDCHRQSENRAGARHHIESHSRSLGAATESGAARSGIRHSRAPGARHTLRHSVPSARRAWRLSRCSMAASAGQSASKRSDTAHARLSRTTVIGMAMGPGFRRELNERKIPSSTESSSLARSSAR
jgi:hypothetical protein